MNRGENLQSDEDTLLYTQIAFDELVAELLQMEMDLDTDPRYLDESISAFDSKWKRRVSEFCWWTLANKIFLQTLPEWQTSLLLQILADHVNDNSLVKEQLELMNFT